MSKVMLILVDGMTPESMLKCGSGFVKEMLEGSLHTLEGKTVMPSVTLPCHMSLFHSVDPSRHGITTNTFTPQVRPVKGICEQIAPLTSAFICNWHELRDLARPESPMVVSEIVNGAICGWEKANEEVTERAINCIESFAPDFCFTYLGWTDEAGHAYGWMGEEYLRAMDKSWKCIERIVKALPEEYITVITADHGGHDRTHGTELDEDMTIPVMIFGKGIAPGELKGDVSIKDIAPTIAHILGVNNAKEWEGKSLLCNG